MNGRRHLYAWLCALSVLVSLSSCAPKPSQSETLPVLEELSRETEKNTETQTVEDALPSPAVKYYRITGIPCLYQYPRFPTGCESISAVMALRFAGVEISEDEFVDRCLPKSNRFGYVNGRYRGPDPNRFFVGSPRNGGSFGCMAPVIHQAITNATGDESFSELLYNVPLPELCQKYVANNVPVLIWVTIAMVNTFPGVSWYLDDGTYYQWPSNEHCVLLVGFDENGYYVLDPDKGEEIYYRKELVERRYAEMGSQAVVIPEGNGKE